MSSTWKLRKVDDFVTFTASDNIVESANARFREANAENEAFLAANPPARSFLPISGTFIYAQPPNYRGLPMLHASPEDWGRLFGRLKNFGVDTVIFQASVWNELETCYYPSRRFSSFRCFDCVDKMLRAAEENALTVYLGCYGSVAGWSGLCSRAEVEAEKKRHFDCMDELFELYCGRFHGIYFAPETAYRGARDFDAERALNVVYRAFCAHVRENNPAMKILMSPATKYFEGKRAEMIDSWCAILSDGAAPDILAPQDSIGCCGNTLEHQRETFDWWHSICEGLSIRFWSNVEVFENEDCARVNSARPARPERVAMQMANASEVAEKLICWELPFYTDTASNGERAGALGDFLASLKPES